MDVISGIIKKKVSDETEKEIIGVGKSYTFTRKSLGPAINFISLD